MTVLRNNLKRLLEDLEKQGVTRAQLLREVDIGKGQLYECFEGKRKVTEAMLKELSKSQSIQTLLGLDEVTLHCLLTYWLLADSHPGHDLHKSLKQVLSVMKSA